MPIFALAAVAVGWRAWYAVQFSQLLDCGNCLVAPAIFNEAQPFLMLLCLAWATSRWLPHAAIAVRAATVAVLCLSWADIAAQRAFATRLSWYEVRKFWNEAGTLLDFAAIIATGIPQALLATLGITAVLLILGRYLARQGANPSGRVAAWGACLLTAGLLVPGADTHRYYVRGSLSTFMQTPTRHTPYPADWRTNHGGELQSPQGQTCHPPQAPLGVNRVVLIVVESLSSYQSQGYGGIYDWTPRLDEWARKGWKFTRFLANGKTTEDGLYALLTGHNPIPAPGLDSIYAQPLDGSATLPAMLARHGFHTAFLTSGDLGFMQKGAWLNRVGFDEIEGHEAPFYDGHQRYHFGAVQDDVLYGRALQWMADRTQGTPAPYLLVLETVSSHQPYYDPVHRRISTEGAFRYTDAALGRFIDRLHATGFLDTGLLIVTSDHRAMVPATADERSNMGRRHLSRIPLLLLGQGIPAGRTEAAHAYSQQDLLPSLAAMLTGQAPCTPPWQGIFTPTMAAPPACVASSRAPQPDSIFLQCGKQDREVRLDAQHTRYLHSPGDPAYLRLIHAQRLGTAAPTP
ncbi:MAG TPA: LTA synthase family protein [Alicycliphilus sp.]|nr:LTA synthase family protein [Alicycliphilus sp.]